jgi:hypothetical protein
MAGPVTAYNWVQGTTAAIVGPTRSRLRQVVIYAAAAGAFTLKNGSASGDTLLTQKFPTGPSLQVAVFMSQRLQGRLTNSQLSCRRWRDGW